MFRGREITHKELGSAILDDVVKDLKDVAVVEQMPRMEGRQMFMIIAPNPKVAQRARELARQQAAAAEKAEAAGKPAAGGLAGGKKPGDAPGEGTPAVEAPVVQAVAEMAPTAQASGAK
jgi:translation initiation factor IF-3